MTPPGDEDADGRIESREESVARSQHRSRTFLARKKVTRRSKVVSMKQKLHRKAITG